MRIALFLLFTGAARVDGVAAQTSAPPSTEEPCLAQSEVHGGYPRYRIVNGRRCWHASTRAAESPAAKQNAAPIDINPYGDPIWESSNVKPSAAALGGSGPSRADCEEQALKLESQEKRTFLRQCMSGRE